MQNIHGVVCEVAVDIQSGHDSPLERQIPDVLHKDLLRQLEVRLHTGPMQRKPRLATEADLTLPLKLRSVGSEPSSDAGQLREAAIPRQIDNVAV